MSFTLLILLVVYTVDAMMLQAEMAVFNSTPLPNVVLKALFIFVLIIGGIARLMSGRAQAVPRLIFRLWFGFTIFLILETLILILRFGYPPDYVLFSYNAYYFAILLLPLFFYFRESLSESLTIRTLVLFFVPLTFLGLAQHFSDNALVPTTSPNGYLQIMSIDFLGSIRAFSLFESPANFGHFLALVGGLGLALYLSRSGSAKKGIAMIVLALLGGYSTFTRATELEIACAMFTVWMLYRSGNRTLLFVLPLVYGILGLFVAYVAPLLGGSEYGIDLLSDGSVIERYASWARYGTVWLGNGIPTFLFGAGLVQNDRFSPGEGVVVDNSFIGIGVHIGAVGLVFWLIITWVVWKYMVEELKRSLSPVRAAAAGAYSIWLFTSVFGISLFYPLPFLLFLVTTYPYRKHENSTGPIRLPTKPKQRQIARLEGGAVAGPA